MAQQAIRRFEDWPRRLTAFLAEKKDLPFSWGENDCMLFCADAVLALTGTDLAEEFRGQYDTKDGADSALDQYGNSLEYVLSYKLGQAKPIGFASRGDIVLFAHDGQDCGGVVDESGRRVALFIDGRGLSRVPLSACRVAWGY